MADFFQIVLSFPTVVFTGLLALAIFVLALSVISGLGADAIDLDVDLSGAEDAGTSLFQVLSTIGVGKIPMSFFAAAYAFAGWILSYLAVLLFVGTGGAHFAVGTIILIVVALLALPVSGLLLAPMTALVESDKGATTGQGLIGEVCTVASGRVDEQFGRGRCYVDATELVLSVRCKHDNDLSRGDEALIIGYDGDDDIYVVESVDAIMGEEIPQEVSTEETVLEDIDFEDLEKKKQRHREEKEKVAQG